MRTSLASSTAILLTAAAFAQSQQLDLSGRWRLVEPTAAHLSEETLTVSAPGELLIKQTPLAITVEHPSKPGTHPKAGIFGYGSGGMVRVLGNGILGHGTWGVTHIGTQLMISHSMTAPPDGRGVRITITEGSLWRLEGGNRLVIEFGDDRTGERPKIATRVYEKVAGQ